MGFLDSIKNWFSSNTPKLDPPADMTLSQSQRVDEWRRAISLYEGRQMDILRSDLYACFEATEASAINDQALVFNILKKIVDKLAMLYVLPPVLTIGGNDQLNISEFAPFKQADRYSELCGIAWVTPIFDGEKKILNHTVITPDQIDAIYNPFNPSKLEEVIHYSYITNSENNSETIRTVWTPESFYVFDSNNKDITDTVLEAIGASPNPERVNPYGAIPFVPLYPVVPLSSDVFGNFREDLVQCQRVVNKLLSHLSLLIQRQSFGQMVIYGDPGKDIAVGLTKPIVLPPEVGATTSAEFISPDAKIAEVWNAIKQIVQYAAFLHNLSTQWVEGSAPSGEYLKVVASELSEYRRDKQDSHKAFWANYLPICAAVLKSNGIGAGTISDFSIEFSEQEVYRDETSEIKNWLDKIKAGISNRSDWLREGEPQLDVEEAKKLIRENLAFEKELAGMNRISAPTPTDFMSFNNENSSNSR